MKFEILAGLPFTADIAVNDGQLNQVLDPGDTATFQVNTVGSNPKCIIPPVAMTIKDADNGLFTLVLTAEQTTLLKGLVAFQEDRFPTLQSHIGIFAFTLVSGNRQATVPIFVKEVVECPLP